MKRKKRNSLYDLSKIANLFKKKKILNSEKIKIHQKSLYDLSPK